MDSDSVSPIPIDEENPSEEPTDTEGDSGWQEAPSLLNDNTLPYPTDTLYSDIPFNPTPPDFYSTQYDMTGALTTESQRRTVHWYGGLNEIGLMDKSTRQVIYPYFGYKNDDPIVDLYQIYKNYEDAYHTEEYFAVAPVNPLSDNPIIVVLTGSHTTSQFYEAYQTIGQDNTDFSAIQSFNDVLSFIDTLTTNDISIFKGGSRHLIITGHSLGGAKAIYAHHLRYSQIYKTVVFNPHLGKWNTGYSSDPYANDLLNPWHKARIDELTALQGHPIIPNRFQNIFVNYVEADFASKYWQSTHEFNGEQLALSWGVNFKYPSTDLYDALPADLQTWISQNTGIGKQHSIKNFVTDDGMLSRNPQLFLYGIKTIHTVSSFQFAHQTTRISFKWINLSATPQLATIIDSSDELSITADHFDYEFIPDDYNGLATLTSNTFEMQLTFEIVGYDLQNEPIYIIINEHSQLAYFDRSLITSAFLEATSTQYLAINWGSRSGYNSLVDGSEDQEQYHFQFGAGASSLTGMRRVLDASTIDPLFGSLYSSLINWNQVTYNIVPENFASRHLEVWSANGALSVVSNTPYDYGTETPGNTWYIKNLDIHYTDSENTVISHILCNIESVEYTPIFTIAENVPTISGGFYSTGFSSTFSDELPQVKLVPVTDMYGNIIPDYFNILNNVNNPLKNTTEQWTTSGIDPVYWDDSVTVASSSNVAYMWKFTEIQ